MAQREVLITVFTGAALVAIMAIVAGSIALPTRPRGWFIGFIPPGQIANMIWVARINGAILTLMSVIMLQCSPAVAISLKGGVVAAALWPIQRDDALDLAPLALWGWRTPAR